MSLLWAVGPIVIAALAVLLWIVSRDIQTAATDLSVEFRRLGDVHLAVVDLRADAARTRATAREVLGQGRP